MKFAKFSSKYHENIIKTEAMETPAKKAKIQAEIVCLDPLEYACEDLHDMILQHLNKKEVLNSSEVSPNWNSTIGKSSVAMSKIQLKIERFGRSKSDIPELFLNSERHYNNLDISIYEDKLASIVNRMHQLVEKFSPWLKNLALNVYNDEAFPIDLTYPKLETLKIGGSRRVLFLPNATNLKKLQFYSCGQYSQELIDWIKNQERLEELIISFDYHIFFDCAPIAPKGLKRFIFQSDTILRDEDPSKLNNFLTSARETLTHLSLGEHFYYGSLDLIFNQMPQLKTFHCENIKGPIITNLSFKVNENITKLSFPYFDRNMVKSLVNLETFYILDMCGGLNIEEFEWIAQNMKRLNLLGVSGNQYECEERYEEMKKTEADINKDIKFKHVYCAWW
jgi:hypothetical protein